jgi:DivIVA domain-containing protein
MTSKDERSHEEWGGRLTPSDVHHVLFTRAGFGRRGYDEVEVDVFLERVQQELTRLIGEKADLRDEVSRLKAQLATAGSGSRAASAVDSITTEEAQLQAVRLLAAAQQTADTYVADAEKYSQRLTADAREHSEQMVAEAREAATRMVAEAERLAGETAARTIDGEVVTSGGPTREEVDAQVAYLKTFGQVVRVQLRAYLEALLRDVEEEWGRADPGVVLASGPAALPTGADSSADGAAAPDDVEHEPPSAAAQPDHDDMQPDHDDTDGTGGTDDQDDQEPIDLVEQSDGSINGSHARTRKRTVVTLHSR